MLLCPELINGYFIIKNGAVKGFFGAVARYKVISDFSQRQRVTASRKKGCPDIRDSLLDTAMRGN